MGQEKEIVKGLSNYYYTFVDVMQFKVRMDNLHVRLNVDLGK